MHHLDLALGAVMMPRLIGSIFPPAQWGRTYFIAPVLQKRQQRLREARWFAQGHAAGSGGTGTPAQLPGSGAASTRTRAPQRALGVSLTAVSQLLLPRALQRAAGLSSVLYPSFMKHLSVFLTPQPNSPTSWPRCPLRTRRPLKADPDPQGLLEKMGFQVGQAPSGSQEGQGRGVWRDPLAP